jgi:hypothetical protein
MIRFARDVGAGFSRPNDYLPQIFR